MQVGTMGAGLVLPPSPTRHRRPRGPQETVEAALPAPGESPQPLALAMPKSRRGGERGARQREKQHGRPQAETPCQFGGACRNHKAGTCKFYHAPPLEAGQIPELPWQPVGPDRGKNKGGGKAPAMLPIATATGRFPAAPTVPQQAKPYVAKRPCVSGTPSGAGVRQRTDASGSTPAIDEITETDMQTDLC